MKTRAIVLILAGIFGAVSVLVFKVIRHTFMFIGPKSSSAFLICGVLVVIGSILLLKGKKK